MWNWNSGYRHFVFNFSVADQSGAQGVGHVHVGSRDCGPKDGLALSDRESCTFLNTPTASIDSFDLASDVVGLELRGLLSGLDFRTDVRDPSTGEVIGEGPGVACHSSPMQPDCPSIFSFLGLDMATGAANPLVNRAFIRLPGAQ